MVRLSCLAVAAASLAGCGDDADKLAACRALDDGLAVTAQASEVQDRKIIGPAAPYPADLGLAGRDAELRGSMAARRAAAWQVVARVLAPVPIAEPALIERFGSATLPAWATWYHRDDFERLFKRLYAGLGPDGRRARAPFTAAAIAEAVAWNPTAIDELESWPEQRYLDYLDAIDTPEELAAVGEVRRVAYSPGALTHLLASYPEALACRIGGVPPAYVDGGTAPARDVVAYEAPAVADCELHVLGPFQVADGAALRATLQGGGGDADLYLRRGAPPTLAAYDCRTTAVGASDTCSVDGGGPVYVGVLGVDGGGGAARVVPVEIAFRQADQLQPACLAGPFPSDAVVVKAAWSRDFGDTLVPTFDTSAAAMGDRLDPGGSGSWGDGVGGALPGPRRHLHARRGERRALPPHRPAHHVQGAPPLDVDHAVVVADA